MNNKWTAENYLQHHGIKGQKWGIRRFQNTDGTLTELGKIRYGSGNGLGKDRHKTSDKSSSPEYKDFQKSDLLSEDKLYDKKHKERAIAAADLGLKALAESGIFDKDEFLTKNKNSDRAWFLYEDQTIGLPAIADLIIRGKSVEDVNKMIRQAHELGSSYAYEPGIFELREVPLNDRTNAFIETCYRLNKRSDSEGKNSK